MEVTPDQLKVAGHRLYGRKKWKARLAEALAVDVSTIHRLMHRPEIPGPYEVAIKGLLENKRAMAIVEKQAKKLLPRKLRRKKTSKKAEYQKQKKEKLREKTDDLGDTAAGAGIAIVGD